MRSPFCRAVLDVLTKVRPSPVEAIGKVPVDFGLVQIPPLEFDYGPAAPKPDAGLLPSTEFPPTATEWGPSCILPIKQIELNDARVFES